MKKIIVSGNQKFGLAEKIKEIYPTAAFHSRSSNGADLKNIESHIKFARESLNYDVYINCSSLSRFRQTLLLEEVYKAWSEAGHSGHIIVLGSTADTPVKGTPWIYPIEKKALRAYCRNLSMASLGGHGSRPSGIRMTYISPGYIDTPKMREKLPEVKKLDPAYIAGVIKWVIDQPEHINISELCMDPIQTEG